MSKLSRIEAKRQKVTDQILAFFKNKFGSKEIPVDFETSWPITKWDSLQTETRDFSIELHLPTGRVIDITEEIY